MEGLTRGYAARLVKEGITVNAVAPSLIETSMMPAGRIDAGARIPLGRLGRSEEVAQATLMVLGNAYLTGQTIRFAIVPFTTFSTQILGLCLIQISLTQPTLGPATDRWSSRSPRWPGGG